MGPINWLAVVVAAAIAFVIAKIWRGPLAPSGRRLGLGAARSASNDFVAGLVFLLGAAMLGHALARIGGETLAARPWLYFMQSGGLAVAFIIPAVWLTNRRLGVSLSARLSDSALWLVAYLAMGATFWLLAGIGSAR